ncbi:hypothetical protein L226DRAFT_617720 [Lentinus tigrinus ALCF2SS1-7]|uniref:C2 domain-containing protein n=1 Tax=Lentinus tigrinus ALCF2SS1-6 TaxID=1328759 RepID=A0A5C2RMQ1_9APHY|nr:hypothetical protein L227DRAFT_658587 [Lentinus tigrinus ALCF2SS1-6]RPD68137.1 hypothetical protein L226DRAFT_617720 [Lentinus tigrinus ALCF2SS1-7]
MTHNTAEPYSGKNPVPTIATKLTSLVNPEKATRAKAQQLQDRSVKRDEKKTAKTANKLSKGHAMRVTDPTTGEEIDIRNADEEPDTRPKGNNVLHQPFPPPDWKEHRNHVLSITNSSIVYISGAFVAAFIVSNLFASRILRILCLIPPVFLSYTLFFRMNKVSEADFEQRVWQAERIRGLAAGSDVDGDGKVTDEERTRESAEWANAVVRELWPIFNTDMFSSLMDMLEDIMQSSVPSFIHSVRVADLGLGSNAGRITSIRSLPDVKSRDTGEVHGGNDEISALGIDTQTISPDDREAIDGDHVNLELSFAYQGVPTGRTAQSKAKNIHLLVEFFLGLKNVYNFRVPVWVEITGVVGTARARLQLIPDPPFVKTTLVTLLGLPQITISVVPMSRILPNVMEIPFISGFISSALGTAAAEYVAPKSLILDLQRLISGDDIKKDTEAIGVLVVHIHRATGVKKMDTTGSSADPYVTLTYSRLEKPLYSTRIIKGDCNPVFEETAVLLVDVDMAKLRERLSFQLWDSDRMSVDDMLGFVEIDIVDLIRQRGKPVRRVSPLSSPDSQSRPGSLEYTVGYYGKVPPNKGLMTDGSDPRLPDDLRKRPEFKDARSVALNDLEAAVLVTPPDEEWPSGLLSMQVHEIRDLSVKTMGKERKGGKGGKGRQGEKGQDDGEETSEEAEGLPSSYCTISLNDELVYETRAKPMTSSPIFNAGTERFVRDWRKAHIAVTVKDSRMRENDVVLGTVYLKLSEVFVNASEVTRCYSLEKGLGTGRIRISLLFRPVDAKLPPNLLGFDTGALEIRDVSVHSEQVDLAKCEVRLKITTGEAEEKVARKAAEQHDDEIVWAPESPTKLPVRKRYAAALLISFRDASGFKSSGRKALGVLWLRDLVDRAEGPVEVSLWRAKDGDYSRLKLNYVPPNGDLSYWDSDREKVECVGSVFLDLVFWPGIGREHYEMLNGQGARKRGSWDEFDRQKKAGFRDAVGELSVKVPQDHQAQESDETAAHDGEEMGPEKTDKTMTDGPVNTQEGDNENASEDVKGHGTNTTVSADSVEVESSAESTHSGSSGADEQGSGNEAEGGKKHGGIIGKAKEWRKHQKELHQDHRGIMQAKPMRTAEWIKDSVEDSAHAVKDRFKMKTRQPDVETEV